MNIVGYKSPFKKKASPLKNPLALAQIGLAVAPGLISAAGSLYGRKARKKEQKKARQEFKDAKKAFESIEYVNPYANLQDQYAGLQNPYGENVYEDLTVDTQAADYLREQQQQSQANLMQQFRGAAGGSGVASLAQSLSNVANQQARQSSIEIAKQERANQLARVQGEQARRVGEFGFEMMKAQSRQELGLLKAQGEDYRKRQEDARTAALYGLAIDRKTAADQARQTARSQFFSGLGSAVGGVAGLYAPGGMRANMLGKDLSRLGQNIAMPFQRQGGGTVDMSGETYDPSIDYASQQYEYKGTSPFGDFMRGIGGGITDWYRGLGGQQAPRDMSYIDEQTQRYKYL